MDGILGRAFHVGNNRENASNGCSVYEAGLESEDVFLGNR